MTSAQAVVPQAAKNALVALLTHSLEVSLKTESYSSWELRTLGSAEEYAAPEFTMLTISSYDFRMFVLLHSSCSASSMRYAANALKIPFDQLTAARYYDFIGELGNRFCGMFKRDLGTCFPHMGMSTPNRLSRASLKHIKNLSFAYDTHVNARAADETSFCASLYVSFYGTREFRVDPPSKAVDQAEVGELELF